MAKERIKAGERYKWLTTVKKLDDTYRNSHFWLCKCSCGRRVEAPEFDLLNGKAGCCIECVDTMIAIRAHANLRGRKVQKITILGPTGEMIRNSPVYLCKCNLCGSEFKTTYSMLRKGQVVACPECAKTLPPPPDLGIK